ncbi:hypothetical protein ACRAVF_31925 [Bradyrhizobium oligotrophicum S58]
MAISFTQSSSNRHTEVPHAPLQILDRVEHDQVLRKSADREQNVVLLLRLDPREPGIQQHGSVVAQPGGEARPSARRIEPGREQLGGVDLAEDVLELDVRTAIESFAEDVSE